MYVMVIIRFRVQFVINLHEWVFQKAEIAQVQINHKLKEKTV